ncbi:hypothetical protein AD998_17340 [bacterium 336/3]|nr:hypothetical protein AD998_17340 [bacterium 336/3]
MLLDYNNYKIIKFIIKLILIPFLTFEGGMLNAQQYTKGAIKGSIIDEKTKQPLIGANIQIIETKQGAITDTSGNFSINNVVAGNYTFQVSYAGYLTKIIPDQSVLKDKILSVTVELSEDDKILPEIQVQSFRYENNKMKPISTFSFSRDEISLNPGAQGDIFRAIGMLPGVTSSGGIYSAIAVRGQGVRDNVYMVDDIPLTEVGHLEGNSFFNDPNGGRFSIFAPRVIDNAVFQGGAFGAEFGRRSASYLGLGIKEGNKENIIIDGQVDLLGITLNYDGPSYFNKKTTMFISGRYQNFYPLVNLVGLQNLGLPSYGDFILKTTTEINSKNKLSILAMVCPESFVRNMDNVYADKELNLLYLPNFKRNKIVIGANMRTLVKKKGIWKNILYFTNYTSNVNVGKAYPKKDSTGTLKNTTYNFINPIQTQEYNENKWGYRSVFETSVLKNDRITIGIEADILQLFNNRKLLVNDTNFVFRRNQLLDSTQNFQVITPNLVNSNFKDYFLNSSAFISYFIELSNRLSINVGIRADYSNFSKQIVVAPRGNISYYLNDNNSLSFGLGIYYQDPVYSDIADLPQENILKMERVEQYIFSYKSYLPNDFKIMIEGWYKGFNNMVTTPINGSILRNNNGKGFGKGIDVSLTKRLNKNWHGIISYSYMEVKRNDQDGLGEYNFAFSQPHQINLMLSYQVNKRMSLSGKYRYATGRPTDNYQIYTNILNNGNNYLYGMELLGRNQGRLPYFSSLDIRINYAFHLKKIKFTTFFDVVNILN